MKYLNIIKNTMYALGVTLLICAAILVVAGKFGIGGIRVLVVQSGSMEPTIGVKSIVLTAPTQSYNVGDIITFKQSGNSTMLVTHRVKEIQRTEFITKGDANKNADAEPVSINNIIGKTIIDIPWIGYVISFIQTIPGFILLIVVPAVAIVYSEIINIKKSITQHLTQRKVGITK